MGNDFSRHNAIRDEFIYAVLTAKDREFDQICATLLKNNSSLVGFAYPLAQSPTQQNGDVAKNSTQPSTLLYQLQASTNQQTHIRDQFKFLLPLTALLSREPPLKLLIYSIRHGCSVNSYASHLAAQVAKTKEDYYSSLGGTIYKAKFLSPCIATQTITLPWRLLPNPQQDLLAKKTLSKVLAWVGSSNTLEKLSTSFYKEVFSVNPFYAAFTRYPRARTIVTQFEDMEPDYDTLYNNVTIKQPLCNQSKVRQHWNNHLLAILLSSGADLWSTPLLPPNQVLNMLPIDPWVEKLSQQQKQHRQKSARNKDQDTGTSHSASSTPTIVGSTVSTPVSPPTSSMLSCTTPTVHSPKNMALVNNSTNNNTNNNNGSNGKDNTDTTNNNNTPKPQQNNNVAPSSSSSPTTFSRNVGLDTASPLDNYSTIVHIKSNKDRSDPNKPQFDHNEDAPQHQPHYQFLSSFSESNLFLIQIYKDYCLSENNNHINILSALLRHTNNAFIEALFTGRSIPSAKLSKYNPVLIKNDFATHLNFTAASRVDHVLWYILNNVHPDPFDGTEVTPLEDDSFGLPSNSFMFKSPSLLNKDVLALQQAHTEKLSTFEQNLSFILQTSKLDYSVLNHHGCTLLHHAILRQLSPYLVLLIYRKCVEYYQSVLIQDGPNFHEKLSYNPAGQPLKSKRYHIVNHQDHFGRTPLMLLLSSPIFHTRYRGIILEMLSEPLLDPTIVDYSVNLQNWVLLQQYQDEAYYEAQRRLTLEDPYFAHEGQLLKSAFSPAFYEMVYDQLSLQWHEEAEAQLLYEGILHLEGKQTNKLTAEARLNGGVQKQLYYADGGDDVDVGDSKALQQSMQPRFVLPAFIKAVNYNFFTLPLPRTMGALSPMPSVSSLRNCTGTTKLHATIIKLKLPPSANNTSQRDLLDRDDHISFLRLHSRNSSSVRYLFDLDSPTSGGLSPVGGKNIFRASSNNHISLPSPPPLQTTHASDTNEALLLIPITNGTNNDRTSNNQAQTASNSSTQQLKIFGLEPSPLNGLHDFEDSQYAKEFNPVLLKQYGEKSSVLLPPVSLSNSFSNTNLNNISNTNNNNNTSNKNNISDSLLFSSSMLGSISDTSSVPPKMPTRSPPRSPPTSPQLQPIAIIKPKIAVRSQTAQLQPIVIDSTRTKDLCLRPPTGPVPPPPPTSEDDDADVDDFNDTNSEISSDISGLGLTLVTQQQPFSKRLMLRDDCISADHIFGNNPQFTSPSTTTGSLLSSTSSTTATTLPPPVRLLPAPPPSSCSSSSSSSSSSSPPSSSRDVKVSLSGTKSSFPTLLSPGIDDISDLMVTVPSVIDEELLDSYRDLILDRDSVRDNAQLDMASSLRQQTAQMDHSNLLQRTTGGLFIEPVSTRLNFDGPTMAALSKSSSSSGHSVSSLRVEGNGGTHLNNDNPPRPSVFRRGAHHNLLDTKINPPPSSSSNATTAIAQPASSSSSVTSSRLAPHSEHDLSPLNEMPDASDDDDFCFEAVSSKTFFTLQKHRKQSESISPEDAHAIMTNSTPSSNESPSNKPINSQNDGIEKASPMLKISLDTLPEMPSPPLPISDSSSLEDDVTPLLSNPIIDLNSPPVNSQSPTSAATTTTTTTTTTTSPKATTVAAKPTIPRRPVVVRPPTGASSPTNNPEVLLVNSPKPINPALQQRPSISDKRMSISLHNTLGPRHQFQDEFDFLDTYLPKSIQFAKKNLAKMNNGTLFHYFFRAQIDLLLSPEANHNKLKSIDFITKQQIYQDKRRVELFAQGVLDHELFVAIQKLFFSAYLNINGQNSLPGIILQQLQLQPNAAVTPMSPQTTLSSAPTSPSTPQQTSFSSTSNGPRRGSLAMGGQLAQAARERENAPDTVPFYKLKDYYGFSVEDYWSLYLGNSIYSPNYE